MNLAEIFGMQGYIILPIIIAVFIAVASITTRIDWGKIFKKENQTQFMGIAMTIIATLVFTFCISGLILLVGGSINSMIV